MKKLVLGIVALMAVGASAQTRHYATEQGVVTALPGGAKVHLVEVAPVRVVPMNSVSSPVIYTAPATQGRLMIREIDTADTGDDIYYIPADSDHEVIYRTRVIRDVRGLDGRD